MQSVSTTDSATSSMQDTSMNKMSDTSMNKMNTTATTSSKKKKMKASIEKMSENKSSKYTADKNGVYDYAEVMPSFAGGSSAIEYYVNNHINFPDQAINDNKDGKVNVKFIINEDGTVKDAHSLSPKLGDGLDEEAARVVSSMPKWTPGTVHGKPVKVSMTLPIIFKTEEE